MRKVKDAKDLSTNELIYFKGHAKATYMSDGTTVEDAINNIEVGDGADLSDYATKEELSGKQDTITDLETIRQGSAKGSTSVQQGTLSTVATSGSYNDLTDKPTIPNAVSESTVSDWGFTKNKGTVTGVKVNGSTKNPSNGVVDIGTVITSHQDISGKQDKLVSGTNIKTINGTSILGSGNIIISGSGEGSLSNSNAYQLVNHGTSDTTFALTPNTFHVWDLVDSLTLTIGDEIAGVSNEYIFQFTSDTEPTTLILPDSIKFNSDFTVEANKIYQISILNGLGTVMSWDIEPTIQLITFTIDGTEYQAEEGMYWEEWINKYTTNYPNFRIQNNYIYFYNNMYLVPIINSSSQPVHINDIIQKNDIYYYGVGGGAD